MDNSKEPSAGWKDLMKIVVAINMLHRGGAERVVCRLTQEWAKRHNVVIALFSATPPAYDHGGRLVDLRLPARTALEYAYRFVAGSIRLARLFQQEEPDRVVSFMESANFPAIAAAAMTGFLNRLFVSVRINPSMIPTPYRVLIPWLYRFPETVVAASDGVKEKLEEMGVPAAKLLFIPNPIVTGGIVTSGSRSPVPFRFILGAGRLVRPKGFKRLLTAFSNVDRSDLHLVILGDGDERRALISLAHELGIESRMHFPGAVSDIETWYRHAECFVLSSHYEGWPNVLMEAMANGCPVVSFDCRYGPAEIFEDGKSGLLVAQDDVEGLTATIVRAVSDGALRRRLMTEGKARGKLFAVEKIAPRWLARNGVS